MSTTAVNALFTKASARAIMECKEMVQSGLDNKTVFLINYKGVMTGYIDALFDLELINVDQYKEFSKDISTLYRIYTK